MSHRLLDVICPEGGGRLGTVEGLRDGSLFLVHSARRWSPTRNWERLDSWVPLEPRNEVVQGDSDPVQILNALDRSLPDIRRLYGAMVSDDQADPDMLIVVGSAIQRTVHVLGWALAEIEGTSTPGVSPPPDDDTLPCPTCIEHREVDLGALVDVARKADGIHFDYFLPSVSERRARVVLEH